MDAARLEPRFLPMVSIPGDPWASSTLSGLFHATKEPLMSGWRTLSGLGSALGGVSLLALSVPASGAVPASPLALSHVPEIGVGVEPESGPPAVPAVDQEVILITGSTGGLGEELARRLAARGAHVILHGRNVERGRALVRAIEEEGAGSASFQRVVKRLGLSRRPL